MSTHISKRTWGILAAGVAAIVSLAEAVRVTEGSAAISDFGSFAVNGTAAVIVLVAVLGYAKGEPLRLQWLLIGLGVALFAAGDLVWAVYEVVLEREPFPSLADVLYVAQYLPFFIGVSLAGLAYRRLVPVRLPLLAATLVASAGAVGVYAILGRHVVVDAETPVVERVLLLAYPFCDLLLVFGPALFIVLVLAKLGSGRLARPWWAVAGGMLVLALTDSGYAYLDWNDLYKPGSLVDYGWMAGYLLIAFGASIAYDMAHPAARPEVRPAHEEAA